MKQNNKRWLYLLLLDLLAGFDIIWTIYLGNVDSWTLYNLSVNGYWRGHEWELRIWGWVTAVLFVTFLFFVLGVYGNKKRLPRVLAVLAGVILSIGVVIPYEMPPNETSFISNLHIGCSLLAPLLLVACIICLLVEGIKRKNKGLKCMTAVMVCLLAVAAMIFIKYTIITTVLELYTVSAISVFLTILVCIAPKQRDL